jgi:hypothetical protein
MKDEIKAKLWMKKIQREARNVMSVSTKVWRKYGWQSGSDIKEDILKRELMSKLKGKKLSPVITRILEDANYHTENNILEAMGMFRGKGYYSPSAEKQFSKYKKLGGKTWQI